MVAIQTPLFQLMSARMRWLGEREVILGQNIANADTPDFRPKDLREGDFHRLAATVSGNPAALAMAAPHPAHLDAQSQARLGLGGRAAKATFEAAPDGNAVVLEEQMAKMTRTALDHQMTSDLYRKYVGMIRTALGREG